MVSVKNGLRLPPRSRTTRQTYTRASPCTATRAPDYSHGNAYDHQLSHNQPTTPRRSGRNIRQPPSAATKQHHNSTKMRSNRPKHQPTHQARHPGNTRPTRQESKTQARRAALRNKPHNLHQRKRRGEKWLAPGLAPGPTPPVKRPHTITWRQRPSAPQRGHDSQPPTSGRSHY